MAELTEQQAYEEYVKSCHLDRDSYVSEFNFYEWRLMGRPKTLYPKDGSWPTPWIEEKINSSRKGRTPLHEPK